MPALSERPHTGDLCTTIAMLSSSRPHVSGGYMAKVDLIPVFNPEKGS